MKTKKTKTFDCVEMKRRSQTDYIAEYVNRKDQFSSFADFIYKTAASDLKSEIFKKRSLKRHSKHAQNVRRQI